MTWMDFRAALHRAREADPASVPEILTQSASEFGATDLVVYLVDFGQTVLEPLPDRSSHAELPASEPVAASMAGRAFVDQQIVVADRGADVRVWIPLVEGSDRTGVIAVTVAGADDSVLAACEALGILAGYLIAAHARCTDLYNLYRRRRSLSLAASMQWDLLPPLVLRTDSIAVAGLLEPAYDVGGDCFDYAANGSVFDFAIFDAMGHGLSSAVAAGLAMGCYRHNRREVRSLEVMHNALASTMGDQYQGTSFTTGLLGRIGTATGELSWTCAGHPPPLLVRGGQVIKELACTPTPPWGLHPAHPRVGTEALEPGDSLLLYTDGVTEARTPDGDEFGVDRLIDLLGAVASDLLRPEEIVRLLIRSVLDHQQANLRDDATIVLVNWTGAPVPT